MGGHGESKWVQLGEGSLPVEDEEKGLGHIVPVEVYNYVFLSLLILTGITIWVAQYHFGVINVALAMAIATFKAGIVTLYFMHLNWENKITWGIVIYPVFIFALMVVGTLGDMTAKEVPVGPDELHQSITQKPHVEMELHH